jgi:hypothetical protein
MPKAGSLGVAPWRLLDRLAVVIALFKQLQISLNVGIGWVLGLRFLKLFVGARVVAAQHVGEALIVQDLGGRTDDADRLGIGAIGEIEAVQPIIRRGKTDPGFSIIRMFLDRGAEALFSKAEIVAAELFLGKRQVVVRIVANQARFRERGDRLATRAGLSGLGNEGTSDVAWLSRAILAIRLQHIAKLDRARTGAEARHKSHDDHDPRHSDTHHAPRITTRPAICAKMRGWDPPHPCLDSTGWLKLGDDR